MLSSTASDATQRVLLDERLLAGMPALGEIAARALNAGLCSPAGLHRRPWLARLRRALERELFVLHFQPIVRVGDRAVSHTKRCLGPPAGPGPSAPRRPPPRGAAAARRRARRAARGARALPAGRRALRADPRDRP